MKKSSKQHYTPFYEGMERIMDVFKEDHGEEGFTKRDIREMKLTHISNLPEILEILDNESYVIKKPYHILSQSNNKQYGDWGARYYYNTQLDSPDIEFSSRVYAGFIEAERKELMEEMNKDFPDQEIIQFFENQIHHWQTYVTKQSAIRIRLLQPLYLYNVNKKHPQWVRWLQKYWSKYVRGNHYEKVEKLNKKIPFDQWEFELKIKVRNGKGESEYIQIFERAGDEELIFDPTRENTITLNENNIPVLHTNKYYIGKREGPTLQMLKEWLDAKMP
ncbi:MAG: hypothetical protein ACFFD2_00450 [Promethearchaeota archaeon]